MDKLIICIVVFVHFHLFDARFYQNSEVPANAFLQSTSFTAGNIASCLLSCDRIGTNCHGVTFNDQLEHLCTTGKFDLTDQTGSPLTVWVTGEALHDIKSTRMHKHVL